MHCIERKVDDVAQRRFWYARVHDWVRLQAAGVPSEVTDVDERHRAMLRVR